MRTAVLAALILTAASHVSGDVTIDWIITGSPLPGQCATPGELITFVWPDDQTHNVNILASNEEYESCTGITDMEPSAPGYTFTAGDAGMSHYFACGVGPHCTLGQKIIISVQNEC